MAPAKKKKSSMSAAHKAALAQGRLQGNAVSAYLDALAANKPKRGRKRTPDSVRKQLAEVEAKLAKARPIDRVKLVQRRLDLKGELAQIDVKVDISKLEAAFVKHAKAYSKSKGITYAAWREVGVASSVLAKAGLGRGNG